MRSGRYFVGLKNIISKECKGLAYKGTRRGREKGKCEKNKKLTSTPVGKIQNTKTSEKNRREPGASCPELTELHIRTVQRPLGRPKAA